MVSEVRWRLQDTLSLESNHAENWRRWKQQFDIYLVASGKNDKSDEMLKKPPSSILLAQELLELFNTFTFESPGDGKKLGKLVEKLKLTVECHVGEARLQHLGVRL